MLKTRTSVQSQKIKDRAAKKLANRLSADIKGTTKNTSTRGQIVKPANVTKNDPLVKKLVSSAQ